MTENKLNTQSGADAIVVHLIQSQLPMMTAGKITLRNIVDFQTRCTRYFQMVKEKIAEDQKVMHILGSFEDHRITDWTNTQSTTLTIMKFPDFMEVF